MAKKICWSSLALQDLRSIRDYIKRDNPSAGQREAIKIKKGVERLTRFPLSGRKLSTLPTVREIVIGNHRLFYRVHFKQVEILRVYHGKQNIPFIK